MQSEFGTALHATRANVDAKVSDGVLFTKNGMSMTTDEIDAALANNKEVEILFLR